MNAVTVVSAIALVMCLVLALGALRGARARQRQKHDAGDHDETR